MDSQFDRNPMCILTLCHQMESWATQVIVLQTTKLHAVVKLETIRPQLNIN